MNNPNSSRKNQSKSKEQKSISSIGNKYLVYDVIGQGNFGTVRKGALKSDPNFQVAIKLEVSPKKSSQLKMEMHFYRILGTYPGIPIFYGYFEEEPFTNALVIQFLYKDLNSLYNSSGSAFSLMTHHLIALRILELLEYVHSRGLIFRDMKPENFMVGCPPDDDNQMYIIDFGLSKQYIDPKSGHHVEFRQGKKPSGTPRYMSLNAHRDQVQSRRDDIESLCYMLIFFQRKSLPWQGLNAPTPAEKYKKITEKKANTLIEELCENLTPQMKDMLVYSRSMDFYESPDYPYLKGMFEKALLEIEPNPALWRFDWVKATPKPSKPCNTSIPPSYVTENSQRDLCTSYSHNAEGGDGFSSIFDDRFQNQESQHGRGHQKGQSDNNRSSSARQNCRPDSTIIASPPGSQISFTKNGGSCENITARTSSHLNPYDDNPTQRATAANEKMIDNGPGSSSRGPGVKKRKGFLSKIKALFSSFRKSNNHR